MEIFLDVKVKWKWEKSENLQNKTTDNGSDLSSNTKNSRLAMRRGFEATRDREPMIKSGHVLEFSLYFSTQGWIPPFWPA